LQERENEISLHKWSDGIAQLRALEGTFITAEATTLTPDSDPSAGPHNSPF